jgi:hypothetical protein
MRRLYRGDAEKRVRLDDRGRLPELGTVLRRLSLAVLTATTLASAPAFAEESDNESWDGGFAIKAERRSDFVLGFSTGLALGVASGYPNEIAKLDRAEHEAKTGLSLGPGGALWIGGALRDWFTIGVGGLYLGVNGSSGKNSGGAFILRVEAFPLYPLGGALRDLAVIATFGAGGFVVKGEDGKRGEGGFTSVAGIGVGHELFRLGPLALGPNAEYLLMRSQSATAHTGIVGLRALIYAGPG